MTTRTLRWMPAAVALFLVTAPAPSYAHGIGGDAATLSAPGFIGLGIKHMLLGWDHLLFIGGAVLLAGEFKRAAKMVSVFAAGHSLTLICAVIAGWKVPANLVDAVIVMSLGYIGAIGLVRDKVRLRWDLIGFGIFLFGLVHGLGLATRLQAIGLPQDGLIWKVIAFNIGIELGQVTAIFALVVAALFASDVLKGKRRRVAVDLAVMALFMIGSVAAPLMAYRALTEPPGSVTGFMVANDSGCDLGPRTENLPAMGGHPKKPFWGPDEEAPMNDFGHAIGDGYAVVLYPADLPADQVEAIELYIEDQPPGMAVAGADDGDKVRVITFRETLSCDQFNDASVRGFSRLWFRTLGIET